MHRRWSCFSFRGLGYAKTPNQTTTDPVTMTVGDVPQVHVDAPHVVFGQNLPYAQDVLDAPGCAKLEALCEFARQTFANAVHDVFVSLDGEGHGHTWDVSVAFLHPHTPLTADNSNVLPLSEGASELVQYIISADVSILDEDDAHGALHVALEQAIAATADCFKDALAQVYPVAPRHFQFAPAIPVLAAETSLIVFPFRSMIWVYA
jgi:hypothetical protein